MRTSCQADCVLFGSSVWVSGFEGHDNVVQNISWKGDGTLLVSVCKVRWRVSRPQSAAMSNGLCVWEEEFDDVVEGHCYDVDIGQTDRDLLTISSPDR